MTMTLEEWQLKKKSDKEVDDYLEEARQRSFAREQERESVMTRPLESIVDADSV